MKQLIQILLFNLLLLASLSLQASPYQVQPGDLIRISLPGEASLSKSLSVDRQGRILLPEVGLLQVTGLSEAQLQERVSETLAQAYRDLTHLKVMIDKKQILVSVLGYVNQPGEYTLPARGTVQMALHAAGGLRAGAQLNRLQLVRADESSTFDYKAYLDSGNNRLLPDLQSLDSLFVPASPMTGDVEVEFDPAKIADAGDAAEEQKAIKVFGEVNSPGSFSYRQTRGLLDLLMRAGGVTRFAGVEQIRIISSNEPRLFNLKQYLDSGNEALLPQLNPGATIFVPRQEEEIKTGGNMVYIMGEVAKPGAYEGKRDASFMDILANAGGPTRFAETRQIRIIKTDGAVMPFDLSGYTEGTVAQRPPMIAPGDAIFVPEKTDVNEKSWLKISPNRAVRVIGEVHRPGRIEWSDEMSLLDLLAHVGGPTEKADTNTIEVVTPETSGKNRVVEFDLDAFIKRGGSDRELPKITAGSTIRVHELPKDPSENKSQWVRQASDKSIYVFGQVGAPGRYKFTNAMHFLDILSAADGPNGNADIHNIRISHRNTSYARVSQLNLALYFETGDESLLPKVMTGDTIYVPEKERNWLDESKESTVRVLGAVNQPGRYRFNDTMTLLDLLAQAGGTMESAYVQKISVVNLSCCRDQARTFDLNEFSRTGRFDKLPVLRAGDTVYVPSKDESNWEMARTGLRDIFQLVSLAALLGFL
jgi:protein involved in polysaccharide export with SLBB domain